MRNGGVERTSRNRERARRTRAGLWLGGLNGPPLTTHSGLPCPRLGGLPFPGMPHFGLCLAGLGGFSTSPHLLVRPFPTCSCKRLLAHI